MQVYYALEKYPQKDFQRQLIEEDYEIGTPEHCGGLVSMAGLEELGIIHLKTIENKH